MDAYPGRLRVQLEILRTVLGRDDEWDSCRERAFHLYLEAGEALRPCASRSAV